MKKFFAIFFAIFLIFSVSFADIQDSSADILVKMGIMGGYPDGTLKFENNITRAEFCALIMKMIGENEEASESRFSDVPKTHWAHNVINKAAELGYLRGYEDGSFRPSNNITYAESCSILVNLLGYKDELTGKWPTNVTDKANELMLDKYLEELEPSHVMTRGEVSIMLVNSMSVEYKGELNAQDGI